MKKILSILVLAIAAVQFAFAGDIITKDAMKLPLPHVILLIGTFPIRRFRILR